MHTLNRYKGYQTIRPVANTTETAGTGRYTTDNQWFQHGVDFGMSGFVPKAPIIITFSRLPV